MGQQLHFSVKADYAEAGLTDFSGVFETSSLVEIPTPSLTFNSEFTGGTPPTQIRLTWDDLTPPIFQIKGYQF